ncbi:hypothetical protein ACFSMW_06715 [Virgibacillus halophilus]|uniref:Uncharacterized protein n=1 Tax=Tigheibacillus halophilus TaxID=361280 RepID=A0ABU5C620_9BACI|nr:hypothetical protein [Virgibacillus halophilus]
MENAKKLNLDNVSYEQLEEMEHALGMPRKARPYRNYFNCSADDKNWNDLVDKGFATKSKSWSEDKANFHLTYEATKLVYGKRMSKKYYNDL